MRPIIIACLVSATFSALVTGWVINAKHTMAEQKRIIAESKQRERWQSEIDASRVALDTAMNFSSQALQEKQHEIDQINASLAAGDGRVYVRAECPVQTKPAAAEQSIPTTPRLGRAAEQDYLLLRRGIAEWKKALDDCRAYASNFR